MSKSKHTPGPWEALLETLPENERFGLTLEDARRADASVHLLGALERAYELCVPPCRCDGDHDNLCTSCRCEAAIAEARGEA